VDTNLNHLRTLEYLEVFKEPYLNEILIRVVLGKKKLNSPSGLSALKFGIKNGG
jgi:hypothetical protein